ncbi:hypothetical protein MANES_16G024250v8 [Manihot esculenta]|uniref:Uncharacterized protein n=1 Tax=Manihot esculenta TaxID=3983 RepID=A0ACB7G9F2_MANES|nr:hypothetical protein MANES_16G024250v8 [Manihot esculenta]
MFPSWLASSILPPAQPPIRQVGLTEEQAMKGYGDINSAQQISGR